MTADRDESVASPEPESPEAGVPEDIDALRRVLDDERAKAQSFYASWQRAAADFQNYKRRAEEERSEATRFANAALFINLLPLLDDVERAIQNADAHVAGLTWFDGIRLIHRKFRALLEAFGVEEIDADGHPFDPAMHEAVSQGPGPENKVIAVVQKGYRLGDRVVRPAMVIVGDGTQRETAA